MIDEALASTETAVADICDRMVAMIDDFGTAGTHDLPSNMLTAHGASAFTVASNNANNSERPWLLGAYQGHTAWTTIILAPFK